MRKNVSLSMLLLLLLLCGCNQGEGQISDTRFLFDTVVTLTAECDRDTLDGAFLLCEDYEKLLSRTKKGSDVYKLNNAKGFVKVSEDTRKIIDRAVYYSELSDGKFDITVYPVSSLWDFKNQVVPNRDEIAEALKNIDYQSISASGGEVSLGGKKIDLGGIAKGYIADRLADYFKAEGIENALINLGGNIVALGKYNIGIEKPFSDSVQCSIEIKDRSIVTSGIYERCIKKDGELYHHIIDPDTGYGVQNDLASVTVTGEASLDCDALSTVCMLLGKEKGLALINNTENTEAVFIDREGKTVLSSGLYDKNGKIHFKEVTK